MAAETITIEWTNEITATFKATVDKAAWEAALAADHADSFLADTESEHNEQSYSVEERTAYIDGKQVL